MKLIFNISCLGFSALVLTLTGCATQQGAESLSTDKVTTFRTSSGSNNTVINNTVPNYNSQSTQDKTNIAVSEPKKQTFLFSSNEIKDISAAFKPGNCDLSNLQRQSQKYGLSETWVNLYDRTPQPLSKLSDQQKCFLAQSNEVYAYGEDFYDESEQSLNKTWYKGNIPSNAKVATMRYMTPVALIPNCSPELGRPIIIDYEKNDQGKIERTILVNEDFDYSCID